MMYVDVMSEALPTFFVYDSRYSVWCYGVVGVGDTRYYYTAVSSSAAASCASLHVFLTLRRLRHSATNLYVLQTPHRLRHTAAHLPCIIHPRRHVVRGTPPLNLRVLRNLRILRV